MQLQMEKAIQEHEARWQMRQGFYITGFALKIARRLYNSTMQKNVLGH